MKPIEEKTSPLHFYVIGFVLSLILTFAAYFTVSQNIFSGISRLVALALLGLAQALVQLFFFLHLGTEPKPRWHLWAFFSMAGVLVVLIFGSLWIMYNLHYRTMLSS